MESIKFAISHSSWGWCWSAMALAIAWQSAPADAQLFGRTDGAREIPAQPLPQAVARLAAEAHVSIGSAEPLPPVRTHTVRSGGPVERTLADMLRGTGYIARRVGRTAWRIEPAPAPAAPHAAPMRPATPPAEVVGQPIIVTAAKRAMDLARLPRSLSVVRLEGIRQLDPGLATADIAANSEGLTTTALGPGRNRMFLRGVADSPFNGTSPSTVAVMLGDSRLTYSAPDPDLRLIDVDRVELLKGPQGSLYGSGALGGIYRIVPNAPKLDRFEGAVAAGVTVLADGGASASGSAVVNVPVVHDRLGLRVVGYALGQPGWIDTGSHSDSNRERTYGARAALALDAGSGWRAELGGIAQFIETQDSQYVYADGSRDRPAQAAEPHDNDFRGVTLHLAGPLGGMQAVLVSSLTWHEVDDTLDASQGAQSFGLPDPALFIDQRSYRVWDNEARLSGKWGGSDWLIGLSHVVAREEEARDLIGSASEKRGIDATHLKVHDTGLFADIEIPVAPRWSIDGGGRLQLSSVSADRNSAAGATYQHDTHWGFSPSAALDWRPDSRSVAFLRYGSAFRQGGGSFDVDGRVQSYAGDTVRTLELGWRRQLARGGQIEIGASTSWWQHVQSDMLLANGLIQIRDAGNARIYAGEATIDWPLAERWHLLAGATVTHARLVSNRLGIPLDDRRLPVVPDWTGRAGLVRSFRIGAVNGEARAMIRYIGPARLSFDRTLDRPMGRLWENSVELALTWRQTMARFRVDNLTNAAADAFAFGNPFRIRTPQFTPQRPLAVSISVARQF